MRVLQAMAGAAVGGAETFFTRLALALHRAGLDQRLLIRADAAREETLRGAGVEVATARFNGRMDFDTGRRFRQLVADYDPDVVVTWMNRATRFCPEAARVGARFRHIGTPRGYYDPKYYAACDHLVVTTDDLRRFYLDSGWPEARIDVIPNFVPAPPDAAPASRAAQDTPMDAPLLLALGRLHDNKGFDTLLDALAALPGFHLWIGGTGPNEALLKAQAERLGVTDRVRFLGWQADTAPLYAAADIFVCSSRHEPFGNIVIEAWAHGVPIAAAASEGPGMLIADGESGLLAPVDDAPALAAAIARIAAEDGLAATLAAGGRAAWQAGYTEEIVAARYRALFERLAG
jgi:glycosyltransferase involved in cell wall biosynthesis